MRSAACLLVVLGSLTGNCSPIDARDRSELMIGDASAGRLIAERVGCAVCHTIPGVRGPAGRLGPSLHRFADRAFIAGVAANTPDALAQFVRNAPSVDNDTAMPEMPLTDREARDIAAFLYSLR